MPAGNGCCAPAMARRTGPTLAQCAGGPCRGGLVKIGLAEQDGRRHLLADLLTTSNRWSSRSSPTSLNYSTMNDSKPPRQHPDPVPGHAPREPEFDQNRPAAQYEPARAAPEMIARTAAELRMLLTAPGWERATLEKLAFASLNEQKANAPLERPFVRLAWLAFFIARGMAGPAPRHADQ